MSHLVRQGGESFHPNEAPIHLAVAVFLLLGVRWLFPGTGRGQEYTALPTTNTDTPPEGTTGSGSGRLERVGVLCHSLMGVSEERHALRLALVALVVVGLCLGKSTLLLNIAHMSCLGKSTLLLNIAHMSCLAKSTLLLNIAHMSCHIVTKYSPYVMPG